MRREIAGAALLACAASATAQPLDASRSSPTAETPPTETIVVTASHEARTLATVPASVEVIHGAELQAFGYDGVLEALRGRAGLHADQPGARGSRASVYTRGLDPNHTLILIDGVLVNDDTNARGGSFDLSSLGIDSIDRIEIVRGPVSAVHGSSALAGAIHIITRDGRGPDRAQLDASGGRYGYYRTYARAAGQRGPLDLTLSGSYQDEGNPQDIGDFRGAALNASLGLDLPHDARARGTLRVTDSRQAAFPEFSGGKRLALRRAPERRDVRDLSAGLALEARPKTWLDLAFRASAFLRREERKSPGVAPAPPNPGIPAEPRSRDHLQRYTTALHATGQLPYDVAITAGGDIRWERGEGSGDPLVFGFPLPDPSFHRTRVIGGPLIELAYRGVTGLELLAGTRVDFHNEGNPEWTPRVALAYELQSLPVRFHAGYGRGFKLPSIFALENPTAGNSSLRSERSDGFEFGARHRSDSGRYETRITFFHIDVRNLVDFDNATFRLQNLGRVRTRGIELESRIRWHERFEQRTHFTYAETQDESHDRLRNRPRFRGGVSFALSPLPALRAELNALFVSDVADASVPTGIRELDAYARLDLVLTWSPRAWLDVYLALDNLTDADYEEAIGFQAVGIRPRAGIRLSY